MLKRSILARTAMTAGVAAMSLTALVAAPLLVFVLWRAWKVSGTTSAAVTRMLGGRVRFSASWRFAAGMGAFSEKEATCARACTPASVRPEPWGSTSSPVRRRRCSGSLARSPSPSLA